MITINSLFFHRDNTQKARSIQSRLEGFKEELGAMLDVSPSEDLIKDRMRQLLGHRKNEAHVSVCDWLSASQ